MAGSKEKVARDFCLSSLRNDIKGLQDECKKDDVDPDDLEFDYEALKKAWEEYLSSQKTYLAAIATSEDLKQEEKDHNELRNDFNTALKLAKKTIKRSKNKDEPTKEDIIKKAKAEIVSKDKYIKDSIERMEKQLSETEGKLSSFHLDDIKEASQKLETYFQSQLVPAYNGLIDLSTEEDVVKIRKEMETGFKNVQQKIWNMTNSVNDKKVLLFTTDTKHVDLSMVNADTRSSSMIKPQNFHKKLDFPSFESGRERDYPSFKRKWNATVATTYPDSVQRDIIQDKVPK